MEKEINQNTKKSLDINKSIWVSASAGSGKTTILVKRLINLLLNDVDIKKIVCITYTKNGANEMKERIYDVLSKWVAYKDDELIESIKSINDDLKITNELVKKARNLFINIVDNVDSLKIFTIHSFCQQILSKFPIEAGIFPNFSIIDEVKQNELITKSINLFLENIDKYSPLLNKCFEIIINNISSPDIFYVIFRDIIKKQQNDFNIEDIAIKLLDVLELRGIFSDEEFVGNEFLELEERLANIFVENVENVEIINDFLREKVVDSKRFADLYIKMQNFIDNKNIEDYLGVFLKKDGEKFAENFSITKTVLKWERGGIFFSEQDKCYNYKKNSLNLRTFSSTYAMLKLANEIIKNYELLKRQEIVLDYNDLIVKTNNLLQNKECSDWIKYKLDSKIEHILLDEAQDTSKSQWEIIKNLVEEFFSGEGANENKRTLFVVGDEKQSIFSFQGAAPELFSKIYNNYNSRLDKDTFEKIDLNYSFRSGKTILDFVNKFFEKEENLRKITKLSDNIEHKASRNIKSYIELWPLINVKNDGGETWNLKFKKILEDKNSNIEDEEEKKEKNIANYIAKKIKSFFVSKKQLVFRDKRRGGDGKDYLKYKDIMILVEKRTSTFLFYLIKFLNNYNVPNTGIDVVENLFENVFIKDLITLLYFVNFQEYDYNLAILVKSPILDMGENDLKKICDYKNNNNLSMIDAVKELYKDKYDFLNLLIEENKKKNPYEFFVFCLEEMGIKKNILKRAGMEYVSIINEFLFFVKYFVRENSQSSVYFLHYIKNNNQKFKKEFSSEVDQVRIMTRHSSKGLQAPIVFICDINQKGQSHEIPILWSKIDNFNLPIFNIGKKTKNIKDLEEIEKELSMEEKFRLLYVSLTRAENELYICGIHNRYEKKEDKNDEEEEIEKTDVKKETLYDLALQTMKNLNCHEEIFEYDNNLKKYTLGEIEETEYDIKQTTKEKLIQTNYNEKIEKLKNLKIEKQKILVHSASTFFSSKDLDNLFNNKELEYKILKGNAIHKLLEVLPNVNIENTEEISNLYLQNMFNDLEEKDKKDIKNNVYKIMNDPNYSMFFKKENSKAEVSIIGEYNNIDVVGQIDRIVELDDKIIIIDYKNTTKNYKNQEEIPEKYITQLKIYKEIIAKQYQKPIECYILLTNYLKLIKIEV